MANALALMTFCIYEREVCCLEHGVRLTQYIECFFFLTIPVERRHRGTIRLHGAQPIDEEREKSCHKMVLTPQMLKEK